MAMKLVSIDGLRYAITKLKSALAPKSHSSTDASYGGASTGAYGHVKLSSSTPAANGTASAGTANGTVANADHAHPKQAMDKATASAIGAVKPDGTTTTIDSNGTLKAIQMTSDQLWLASVREGQSVETDGWDPTTIGGTWERMPSLGAYTWRRKS